MDEQFKNVLLDDSDDEGYIINEEQFEISGPFDGLAKLKEDADYSDQSIIIKEGHEAGSYYFADQKGVADFITQSKADCAVLMLNQPARLILDVMWDKGGYDPSKVLHAMVQVVIDWIVVAYGVICTNWNGEKWKETLTVFWFESENQVKARICSPLDMYFASGSDLNDSIVANALLLKEAIMDPQHPLHNIARDTEGLQVTFFESVEADNWITIENDVQFDLLLEREESDVVDRATAVALQIPQFINNVSPRLTLNAEQVSRLTGRVLAKAVSEANKKYLQEVLKRCGVDWKDMTMTWKKDPMYSLPSLYVNPCALYQNVCPISKQVHKGNFRVQITATGAKIYCDSLACQQTMKGKFRVIPDKLFPKKHRMALLSEEDVVAALTPAKQNKRKNEATKEKKPKKPKKQKQEESESEDTENEDFMVLDSSESEEEPKEKQEPKKIKDIKTEMHLRQYLQSLPKKRFNTQKEMNKWQEKYVVRALNRLFAWDCRTGAVIRTVYESGGMVYHLTKLQTLISTYQDSEIDNKVLITQGKKEYYDGKPENPVNIWCKSKSRNAFDRIAFDPNNKEPTVFNLFSGFDIEHIEKEAIKHDIIEPILSHIRDVWAKGNEEHYHYIMCFFADIIQNPGNRPGIGLYIYGKQGAGKDIISQLLMGSILKKYLGHCTNIEEVTARFNVRLVHKLLVIMNELSSGSGYQNANALKSVITDERARLEQKGIDAVDTNNYARYIFESNYSDCLKLEASDRRFACFKTSNKYCKNDVYFDSLEKIIKDPQVQAHYFNYLRHYDFKGTNLRRIPNTKYRSKLMREHKSAEERFLYQMAESALHNDEGHEFLDKNVKKVWKSTAIKVTTNTLYEMTKTWHDGIRESWKKHKGPEDNINKFSKVVKKLLRKWNPENSDCRANGDRAIQLPSPEEVIETINASVC
jgi:hypothetical protein